MAIKRVPALLLAASFMLTVLYFYSHATKIPSQNLVIRANHGKTQADFIHERSLDLRSKLWSPFGAAYDAVMVAAPIITGARQQVTSVQIQDAKRFWKTFMSLAPSYERVESLFHGRGIVISGGAFQLHLAYACIKMLRESGCTLPIDLWVSSGRNETLSTTHVQLLAELDVQVYDTDLVANTFQEMTRQMHPESPRTKPYILKQIGLLSARCEECLMLDADNIPVRDPTFLFETDEYITSGHLLWPDFWHMRSGPAAIREIFDLPQGHGSLPDTRSVESGQMVVHKGKAWHSLLLSVFMQVQTMFYDNLMRDVRVLIISYHLMSPYINSSSTTWAEEETNRRS
jgi:alpha 1,2-mannosyltransferase